MTFGEKLQSLRQRAGMSQDALAERLQVSRQAVSRWERDETMPETDKVVALADIFGVTTDYLLRLHRHVRVRLAQAEDALAEIQVTAQGHAAEKVTESLLIGRLHRVCDAGLEQHAAQVLLVIPPWQLTGPVPGKAAGRLPPPHGLRLPPSGL